MIKAESGKKIKSRARVSPLKRIRDKTSYPKDEGKGIKDKNGKRTLPFKTSSAL